MADDINVEHTQSAFDKLAAAADANAASINAAVRAQNKFSQGTVAQQKAHYELIKSLKEFADKTGQSADELADRLEAEEALAKATEERAKLEEELTQKEKEQTKKRIDAGTEFITTLMSMSGASMSASQALYDNNKQYYTAVIPTLELMSSVAKSVVGALGGILSGLLPGLSGFIDGVSKMAVAGIDLATQAAKIQLENAQKYVNTYKKLTDAGVIFGGDLAKMADATDAAGLSLANYSDLVETYSKSLTMFGGSIEYGVDRVTKFGNTLKSVNPDLVAMAGSLSDFYGGIAEFMETQSRYGVDIVKQRSELEAGTHDYLYTLKLLETLTGKKAKDLQGEEEKRQLSAAYNVMMQNMSLVQKNQLNIVSGIAEKVGPQWAALQQEYATYGKITTEAGIRTMVQNKEFASMLFEMVNSAKTISGNSDEDRKQFSNSMKSITEQHIDKAKAIADRTGQSLQGFGLAAMEKSEYLKTASEAAATIQSAANGLKNVPQIIEDFYKNLAAQHAGAEAGKPSKAISDATKGYANIIEQMNVLQRDVDKRVRDNMDKMNDLVTSMIQVNGVFYDSKMMQAIQDLGTSFPKAIADSIDALNKWSDKLLGRVKPNTATSAQENWDPSMTDMRYNDDSNLAAPVDKAHKYTGSKLSTADADNYRKQTKNEKDFSDIITFNGRGTGNREHWEKLDPNFKREIEELAYLYHEKYHKPLTINSAFRDNSEQAGVNSGSNPKGLPGQSKHNSGLAIDIPASQLNEIVANQLLKNFQLKTLPNDKNHIESAYADGGVTKGPSLAGEAGPEAVIPLPDGRNIPVKMDVGDLVSKLNEMIGVLRDHKRISDQILRATA